MQSYVTTQNVTAPLAVDGLASGVIQVAASDAPNLWPGASVIVGSDVAGPVEAIILADLGANKFGVRINDSTNPAQGGPSANRTPSAGSDWSTYLVADSAYISQTSGQPIFPYAHDGVIPRTPSALK